MELLAILGRGIQMPCPNLDPTEVSSWALTDTFEITDEKGVHLACRLPEENKPDVDNHPQVRIGGSQWNTKAGAQLIDKYRPRYAVCAYGDRARYLKAVNGPTESEVMSARLAQLADLSRTEVIIWPRDKTFPGPSNTGREIRNIFDLAIEKHLRSVTIVAIGVHVPRTATYVAKLRSPPSEYESLDIDIVETEGVLLRTDNDLKRAIEVVRNSAAFARSWASEADGIQKIIRDVYKDFA